MTNSSDVDLIIIGAGAAGIGAAKQARSLGLTFKVLEASHRIGGRAYTEFIGPKQQPFDLGCHWMHSASLNPMVKIADEFGFSYDKDNFLNLLIVDGDQRSTDRSEWAAFSEKADAMIAEAVAAGREAAVIDLVPRDDRWTRSWDYIFSLISSFDPDQVSATDLLAYNDTEEDWPLKEGYGELITRFGADIPVELNTQVTDLDWSGASVRAETPKGAVAGRAAVITVSTGILGAGDIRFDPVLPPEKLEAIQRLPLGCHNRIGLVFDGQVFGDDAPMHVAVLPEDEDDVQMTFRLNPFGYDYAVGTTGGRYADWLERAGQDAAVDIAMEKLKRAYGNDIGKRLVSSTVTAWRGDPWVKGAYSAAEPGHADKRAVLREPLGDRLFFAGEATHASFYSTCHGAYLSGIDAVDAASAILQG